MSFVIVKKPWPLRFEPREVREARDVARLLKAQADAMSTPRCRKHRDDSPCFGVILPTCYLCQRHHNEYCTVDKPDLPTAAS